VKYLNKSLDFHSMFWRKKTSMNWFSDSDRNIAFFRAMVTKMYKANDIYRLLVLFLMILLMEYTPATLVKE